MSRMAMKTEMTDDGRSVGVVVFGDGAWITE